MAKIKVIHDSIAHILTVWTGDPTKGAMCEETTDEVVLMKDIQGHVIGIELLHYMPKGSEASLDVEMLVHS